jgi:hypothetical protein
MICTAREYTELTDHSAPACYFADIVRIPDAPWESTIPSSGRYQVVLQVHDTIASVTLHNPTSYLDATWQPCLITKPAFAILLSALFLYWSINWLLNFSMSLTLHTFVSFTIFFALIATILSALEIKHFDSSDDSTGLTVAAIVALFASDTLFCWTTILTAKGWSLVMESLSIADLLVSFFASVLLTVPLACIGNLHLGIADYIFLIAAVVGLVVYYRAVLNSIDASITHVIGHLLVIAERGIDPRTTPIWQKYRMFRGLLWVMLAYFAMQTLAAGLTKFTNCPYFGTQLIRDCASLVLMVAAVVLFRLRQGTRDGYMIIGDQEPPRELQHQDLRRFSLDADVFDGAQIAWEVGMALPSQPILIAPTTEESAPTLAETERGEFV